MRFNLTKNSVINYFMPIIFQSQKKTNLLILIQEEKVTKDLVFIIFGFLNSFEINQLDKTSHFFSNLVNEYDNSLISLKDARNRHISANREFKEQKDLLPTIQSRTSKLIDFLFHYAVGGIQLFGIMSHISVSSFEQLDQTEVFMRINYRQFSCPIHRLGDDFDTIVSVGMMLSGAVIFGKAAMVCANSSRQGQKVKLAEGKVSQTAFYLQKREKTQSQSTSRPNFYR